MTISATELAAIAICCRNSAAMLELANHGEPDVARRQRIIEFNSGQAALLRAAAKMADQGVVPDPVQPTSGSPW